MKTSGSVASFDTSMTMQALVEVHLGGRQADAGRGVHGLEHVVDELLQLRSRSRGVIGFRLGAQTRVRVFEDGRRAMARVTQRLRAFDHMMLLMF